MIFLFLLVFILEIWRKIRVEKIIQILIWLRSIVLDLYSYLLNDISNKRKAILWVKFSIVLTTLFLFHIHLSEKIFLNWQLVNELICIRFFVEFNVFIILFILTLFFLIKYHLIIDWVLVLFAYLSTNRMQQIISPFIIIEIPFWQYIVFNLAKIYFLKYFFCRKICINDASNVGGKFPISLFQYLSRILLALIWFYWILSSFILDLGYTLFRRILTHFYI